MDVDKEIAVLKEEIIRLGTLQSDGRTCVKFKKLFDDERCSNLCNYFPFTFLIYYCSPIYHSSLPSSGTPRHISHAVYERRTPLR